MIFKGYLPLDIKLGGDAMEYYYLIILVLIVAVVACLGRIAEDVKNEQIVVNQYPFTGKMEYWTTPGFKWQMFGKTTYYYKTSQLWFGSDNEDGKNSGEKTYDRPTENGHPNLTEAAACEERAEAFVLCYNDGGSLPLCRSDAWESEPERVFRQ